ncbi:hypothetical protein V5R04_02880 [Jonesiaceae bacterium BS-20]|uniref:Uncharacterized protein n=1 Tax=Jonesiaceae bacterium BS-20 TaxID=3120821 RepID=A0AAU7DW05_9MICO
MSQRISNCSSGIGVDFYWRETQSKSRQDHLDAAVDEIYGALQAPTRRWNRFSTISARGDIRALLIKATEGKLEPIKHVKSLRNGVGDLFEIRWQHLAVCDQTENGLVYGSALARLIHIEPIEASVGFIGILAFEKDRSAEGKNFKMIRLTGPRPTQCLVRKLTGESRSVSCGTNFLI